MLACIEPLKITLTIGTEIMHQTRRFFLAVVLFSTLMTATLTLCRVGFSQKLSPDLERELIAILRSNAPEADKAIACKKLAIDGSNESISDLASLLKDEKLASWARIAIEAIPGPAADEALVSASKTLQGRLLVGVINSLGVRRVALAHDSLKDRIVDKDSDVASAAAVALGRIGSTNSAEVLSKMLATVPINVRSAVAEGLVLCAEQLNRDGKNADAIRIFDDVRTAQVPKQRVLEATRGAILARKADGVPLLLEQLRSADETMFRVGLSTARELSGREVDKALAAELTKATPEHAALVIHAMADRKATVDMAAILKSAQIGQSLVRMSAIQALARVGDVSCVPALLEIALENETDLASAAKTTLAEMSDEGVSKAIADRLSKADGKLMTTLIEVVGLRRIEATADLIKALSNSEKSIRSAALVSLGNTVPPSQLSVLIDQVITPKRAEDLEVATKALKMAAVRMPDREECGSKLSSATEKASLPTKIAILEILGAVGGTKALQAIEQAAKSNDEQLKDMSSRLLGDWMTIDAAPVLLNLAKSGPADKYQVRALRGYIRIARQFDLEVPERIAMCSNALEISRQPAEQKLIIEILKRFPTIDSLKLAVKAVQGADVKTEATEAALAIADKIAGGKAKEAREILSAAGIAKTK